MNITDAAGYQEARLAYCVEKTAGATPEPDGLKGGNHTSQG